MIAPEPEPLAGSWGDVPEDVMVHVFDRLSFAQLARCTLVCRTWRCLSRSDYVWSRRCARRWCLSAMAHFASDSPIRRGWESGRDGPALLDHLRKLGIKDERELCQAADTIAQLRQVACTRRVDGSRENGSRVDGGGSSHEGLWWSLFREVETKPLSTSWLQVGDHVDCRWGDEDNSVYQLPRLRGALQAGRSPAHWEARVLEFGSQEGWVHVHYVGYAESSPWAREWVGNGKLRPTGRVNWETEVQVGDEVEVRVEAAATLHDRMYWPAKVVAVKPADVSIESSAEIRFPCVSTADYPPEPEDEVLESEDALEDELNSVVAGAQEEAPPPTTAHQQLQEHSDDSGDEQDEQPDRADELWTSSSSDEDATDEGEDDATDHLERLHPALLDQAPEKWMRGSTQSDFWFLVRYPGLQGPGAEDAVAHGGHEWVRRDQIYPLRVAADTSGGS